MANFHSALQTAKPYLHLSSDQCPYCEQVIPNDRLDEVKNRIAAKDRQQQADVEARVNTEVQSVRAQGEAAFDALKAQIAARETAAIAQGKQLAEQAMEARLKEAAAATQAATDRGASLQTELEKSRTALTATVEKLTSDFAQKEQAVRAEVRTAAEQEMNAKIAAALKEKQAAEQKALDLQLAQQETLKAGLQEQREALEKSKTEAVNAERSKNFEEKLKLEGMVDELQRKLQNKTADELGEGAEIDLFEVLKTEFPDDEITRVGKGKAGADIIHRVRLNGVTCGCIIYDSKNHQQWRNDHVHKLRQDQLAERAEHAVLSTHAFPSGKRHLHIDNGVIIAKPGRAIVVAMILRKQIVQIHALKISNEERSRKSDELYATMTSDRFEQFIQTVTKCAEQLESMQVQERKAHEGNWKKQGEIVRTVIRSCSQFDSDIGRIIGTAT